MVKKHPWLSLVVGGIWLANTLVCLVVVGVWLLGGWPGIPGAELATTPALTPTSLAVADQAPTEPAPQELPPAPDCGQQVLTLGETSWQVETLARADDGAIPAPQDRPGTAFLVEDSGLNDLFALSPNAENQALVGGLQAGTAASFGSQGCGTTLYTLSAPIPGPVDVAALEDQSAPGLVVFIAENDTSPGLTLRGEPSKLIFSGEPTPPPGATEVEAQIAFLETTTSSDGSAITVNVEVYNYGGQAFTLTANDVSLIPEGGQRQAPSAAKPGLPLEFQPAQRETILFTFPNPGGVEAVFQVFSAEFNLSDFR